jgi:hypothetical protein
MREEDEDDFFTKMDQSNQKKSSRYQAKANKNLIIMKKKKRELNKFTDEIIISHLSTKRKDHNIERFEKLFFEFDKAYSEFKNRN